MRRLPVDDKGERVLRRTLANDRPDRAGAVDDNRLAPDELVVVHQFGAGQASLLLHGERQFDRPTRLAVGVRARQCRQDRREARLVVRAKNGGPIAPNDAVDDLWAHAVAGNHRVHVRRQDDGRQGSARAAPRPTTNDVAVRIGPHLAPEQPESGDEVGGDRRFFAGWAIDLNERQKRVEDGRVEHDRSIGCTPWCRSGAIGGARRRPYANREARGTRGHACAFTGWRNRAVGGGRISPEGPLCA